MSQTYRKALTICQHCGCYIDPAYGVDEPAKHQGHRGTQRDPRAPGDHDNICDVCDYGKGLQARKGSTHTMGTTTYVRPARYRIGQRVQIAASNDNENYARWRGKALVITAVSSAYMPAREFYAKGSPAGYHPGFDESAGCALYDFEGVPFSLYEWELEAL